MGTARNTGQDSAPVIACQLGSEDLSDQAQRWMQLASEALLGRAESEDGLRIRFRDEPEVEQELRALVAVESDCCAWARWEVHRADGELVMQVTSSPEGAAVLHAMFAA